MAKTNPECRKIKEILVEQALSSGADTLSSDAAVHLENCESCRNYAEGVKAAPLLFQGTPLYNRALKGRTLAAVEGSRRSGDWQLGILFSVPIALSTLLSFYIQVYLVCLALPEALGTGPITWALSIAVVTAFGAAAGFAGLAVLTRNGTRHKRLQEVFCD